jgi:hypothetical protein
VPLSWKSQKMFQEQCNTVTGNMSASHTLGRPAVYGMQ